MTEPIRVLYVDDSAADRALVRHSLAQDQTPFVLIEAATRQEFEALLEEPRFDVVLTDFNILGFDGLSVIQAIQERELGTPIIVVTGTGSEEVAAETIKRGAADYAIKTHLHIKRLPHTIRAALERARLAEERMLTQAALQQREALYRAVYEHAPVGIVHATLDGRYTMVNPFFCRMLGYDADELRGKTFREVTHADDLSASAEQVQKALAGGGGYEEEKRFVRADGSVLWANVHVSTVNSAAGAPLFFVGIAVDIDERKRAEESSRKSEVSLRSIWQAMPVGIGRSVNRVFTEVNECTCQILGYSEDELIGQSTEISYKDREEFERVGRLLLMDSPVDVTTETVLRRKDGSLVDALLSVSPLDRVDTRKGVAFSIVDISERKAKEREIQEAHLFLDTVANASPFAMWISDPNGLVIRTNRALRGLLNLSDEQIVGHYNVLEDESLQRQGVMSAVRAVYEEHKPARFSIPYSPTQADPIKFKGGRDLHIDVSMFPILDESGRLANVVCHWVDITRRTVAELALTESEARYRNYVESAPDGIFVVDAEGRYMDVNVAACSMTGYSRDELSSRTIVDLTPPDSLADALEIFATLKNIGRARKEIFLLRKDGSVFPVSLKAVAIPDGRFMAFCTDISKRKEAEAALAASEAQHRQAQFVAHIGHWELDLSTMAPAWSDEVFRIFGLDPSSDEPSFENHEKVTHPDDWPLLNGAVMAAVERGTPFDIKFRIVRPDGEIRWMHALGQVKTGDEGKTERVFGTAQDITSQNEAERALQERELQLLRLAARLHAVREDERLSLARELHDQLGEKLTGMKMDLDWIEADAHSLDDVVSGHARAAAGLVEESMELVHDICTRLRPPMLDILGLRSAIEWYVTEFTTRNKIASELLLDDDDVILEADASTAAFRILQEALTNVVRHSQAVSVTVALRSVADGVKLSIVDDGVGIPEFSLEHKGSLGLLGMHERAAVFGGQVTISRGTAGGTEVALWLPNTGIQHTESRQLRGGGR